MAGDTGMQGTYQNQAPDSDTFPAFLCLRPSFLHWDCHSGRFRLPSGFPEGRPPHSGQSPPPGRQTANHSPRLPAPGRQMCIRDRGDRMEKKKFPQTVTRVIVLMICAAFLALSGLAILYRVDNKYTAKTGMVQEHVTLLPANGAAFLVDGWELYPDRMLTPHDFSDKAPSPRYTVWAGEYPNLSLFHTDGNPYGAATYRLRIKGEGMAALYLQEPLCAARVFVDGRDLGGPGEVGDVYEAGGADMDRGQAGSYRPLIRDTVYSFPVDGEAELIIQTANYSHYYGGLWFPPAIGSVDSVAHMTASRMVFYGVFCFGSLALSLFCICLLYTSTVGVGTASLDFALTLIPLLSK